LKKVIGDLVDIAKTVLSTRWQHEIAVALGAAVAAVNVVQELALPLTSWEHTAILVVTTLAAAFGIRSKVRPV